MTRPAGKTNAEKYEELKALLEEEQQKYDAIEKKASKTAINKLEKIKNVTAQLMEAEAVKDEWVLSKTAESWIKDEAKQIYYGYRKQLKNRYLDKGNANEDLSIEMLNQVTGKNYKKNLERRSLTWLTGEPDIRDEEELEIIDMKNAWDLDTFPAYKKDVDETVKASGYDWQQIGYLILFPKYKRARICYALTQTPVELIPNYEDITLHQVDHIDPKKRITFSSEILPPTKEVIAEIKRAYKAGNKFFKECLTELENK